MALTERYVSSLSSDTTWADSTNPLTPVTWATAVANAAAGDRINVIADGTYARTTTTDTFTNAGTSTSPIVVRGYKTTIGDGYLGRTNGNGALITTNIPLITYTSGKLSNSAKSWIVYESLNITSAISGITLQVGTNSTVRGCKVDNSGTNVASCAIQGNNNSIIIDNDVTLTGASGGAAGIVTSSSILRGNRVKTISPTANCINLTGSLLNVVEFNVLYASGQHGIFATATGTLGVITDNTIVGNTGDGINVITGSTSLFLIADNILTDNGGYGLNMVSAANAAVTSNNRYRDNTSGDKNLGTDWLAATSYQSVTTGGGTSDYVNAAGNDYNLISTSPAVGAGKPSYLDIGALQIQAISMGMKIPSI